MTGSGPAGAGRAHRGAGSLLVDNIGQLVTMRPELGRGPLGVRDQAAVVVDEGRIAFVGDASQAPAADIRLDAAGGCVLPGFVDSHTHLVFAGDRSDEFVARMDGAPYAAFGIARTVAATRSADDAQLLSRARRLADEALRQGTTTIETKSGYGLTVDDERRSLEVARQLTDEVTFLGAHVTPPEFGGRSEDYLALVTGDMVAACAPLARWCDVFVEQGAFDASAARRVLEAGRAHGLGLRVHANQLGPGPGVRLACELGAASADHCSFLSDADVDALGSSATVATLLPGAEFSTRAAYPDGRRLLDAGATVALATDCNPGTSFTTSMAFVVALAVREMRLTVDEALRAATSGGAAALRRRDVGELAEGRRGDLVVLDAPDRAYVAYRPGVDLARVVVRQGEVVAARSGA